MASAGFAAPPPIPEPEPTPPPPDDDDDDGTTGFFVAVTGAVPDVDVVESVEVSGI